MSNWFISLCAFVLLMLSVSAFTMHVFVQSTTDSFDSAKANAVANNEVLVNDTFNLAYAQIPAEQKAQILQITQLPSEQRTLILNTACSGQTTKSQPICDSRFIAGTISFETVMKEGIQKQLNNATDVVLSQLSDKIKSYERFDLFMMSLVCGILSLLLYLFNKGVSGIQSFAGNASWLSVLSAISFKLMPAIINRLISSVQAPTAIDQKVATSLLGVVIDWLKPAMQDAFVASVWMAVIGFIIWLLFKVFRNYNVAVE